MTKTELVKLYTESTKRAKPMGPAGHLSYIPEDRAALATALRSNSINVTDAVCWIMNGDISDRLAYQRHYQRLTAFLKATPKLVTTAHKVETSASTETSVRVESFGVQIKKRTDVQTAFNEVAAQLVKLGITSTDEAASYLTRGYETLRKEHKIDSKVERIVDELRMSGLDRENALIALERAKASFL